MRRYTDRLHAVAGRVTGPCPVTAGRRERRRPAEALPLGQLRVCTTLFGPFTVAAWERQAPTKGDPLWHQAPRWTRRTWAIHPAALSRLWRGVASRDQPPERLRFAPTSRRCTRLSSRGWSRLTPVHRDSAADQPVRRRWGSASRRLCRGAEPLVFRSPVTSSGADGVGLVPVGSREPREPHRPPIRWGGSACLTRFWGIASAPGDRAGPTPGGANPSAAGCDGAPAGGSPAPDHSHTLHITAPTFLVLPQFFYIIYFFSLVGNNME